jgi:predicted ATPase
MIERLELSNFKSLKQGTFDLENLTLFSGLNGMGKSSIFQSLLLLRQSFEKHLLPDIGLSLTGEYVNIGNGKDLLFSSGNDEFVDINLYWKSSEIHNRFDYKESSDMQPCIKESSILSGFPFDESLFTSSFQYLSAERISPKSTYSVSEYAVNQKRSLGKTGEYTAHFLAEHGNKDLAINALRHESSLTATLIDNVNAWMSEITPGTHVIAKLIPEINQASLHYKFSTSTEFTSQFRPENTGFGLTYVLPVITAVLSARPGDLLLIENPESHLHPSGQSLIAKLISIASENEVQIIVETHSDHFLNGVRTSVKSTDINASNVCIYYLYRDEENPEHCASYEEVRIEDTGRMSHWPSGFFDEWDKSLTTLIKGN